MLQKEQQKKVTIVGGGLAGSECALQLAARGIKVTLFEMRPLQSSPAHKTDALAELVCSNSFKSLQPTTAAGELKAELSLLGSYLLDFARKAQVPAGNALAVDRSQFSNIVEQAVSTSPNITLIRSEVRSIPEGETVIAAGPLCSDALTKEITNLLGTTSLSFFDAAAPIVDADSLDMERLVAQSRYENESTGDYLNACFDKAGYEAFINEMVRAERVILKDFEKRELFSACQPAEEVARSGKDALRYGALKPVGITDSNGERPWAVVQLRAEDSAKSAYNLVGFQTNLTFSEQKRVFRMIPGLEQAEFIRFGVMHRNTFIDSPRVLDETFALIGRPNLRFAGQITGTEGYTEAIASGLFAALNAYARLEGLKPVLYPIETVQGALFSYATNQLTSPYQPMHVNFGLVPPLNKKLKKKERYEAYSKRAHCAMERYIDSRQDLEIQRSKSQVL